MATKRTTKAARVKKATAPSAAVPMHLSRSDRDGVGKLAVKVQNAILKTEDDLAWAHQDLAGIRKLYKAFKAKRDDLIRPFKDGIGKLQAEFDQVLLPLAELDQTLTEKVVMCRAALKAEAERLEAERVRAKEAEDRARARQLAAGQTLAPPQVSQEPVVEPARGFETIHGKTSTMIVKRYKVVDESAIPMTIILGNGQESEAFWTLNTGALHRLRQAHAADAKSPIPGIEFYSEDVPVVKS